MRIFIKRAICFLLVTVTMSSILVVFLIQLPAEYSMNSHEYNILIQSNRLDSINGEKIIIIGGSNCGFGIVSPLIEEALDKPVCNTGTHGGIGLKMQLALFEKSVRAGDIVIVCPEYSQFFGNSYLGDDALIRTLATFRRDGYKDTDLRQWLHLSKYFPNALKHVIPTRFVYVDSMGVYHASSLNKQGDITKYKIRKHKDDLADDIRNGVKLEGINWEAIILLKEFTEKCKKKGANVYTFPPVCDTIYYSRNCEEIDGLWAQMKLYKMGVHGMPNSYALNDTLFYDTEYHPTEEGAILRTEKLIKELVALMDED